VSSPVEGTYSHEHEPAGTPASSSHPARLADRVTPGDLPSPGSTERRPGTEPTSPDFLSAFLTEAGRRRDRHTREEPGRPEDWADPDPTAITAVAIGHPVDRAIARHKRGKSRNEFVGALRRACERLLAAEPRSLTPEAVRAYPWHHLDVDTATEYHRSVYVNYTKQTSRNDAICTVRAVVTECYRAALISALRRDLLLEALYTVAPGPSSKRRRLADAEINDLLAACESTGTKKAQARNTAIVALFRTSGIRVRELTRIDFDDWDRDADTMLLRDTKNGRDHLIFTHPDAKPYLERWLAHRGTRPGALFTRLTGYDVRPLNTNTVRHMLKTRAHAAGVAPFSCHDFRRTFATELLRTHDIALVGKLLNHNKTASTLTYDLACEDEQRDAVAHVRIQPLGTATTPTCKDTQPAGPTEPTRNGQVA
jgi:integrase